MIIAGFSFAATAATDPEVAFSPQYATPGDGSHTFTGINIQNRPLILWVLESNSITGVATHTVTVNGNAATEKQSFIRSSTGRNISANFIAAPGANASASIQVDVAAGNMNNLKVFGVYVNGATGIGDIDMNEFTGTSLSASTTTTASNRKALYCCYRNGGGVTLSMTGATLLESESSGFSSAHGWEDAPSAGTISGTFNWTGSSSTHAVALEVLF